jgi:hypothetical protein
MVDFKTHEWPFNGPGFDQRIDSLKKALGKLVIKNTYSCMKFEPDNSRNLIDLSGKPLTPETLMLGKRTIEGMPDFEELTVASRRMQRELRALPGQIRLHPRDWYRLLNQAQPATGVRAVVFDPITFEANLGAVTVLMSSDPAIPPGGWRMESDIDGVGMDALAGPIRKVSLACLTCNRPMEAWVAVDWPRGKQEQQGQWPKSEEAEFLERLRMKVKEKYLAQREVLVEFAAWVDRKFDIGGNKLGDAVIDEFLESKGKP